MTLYLDYPPNTYPSALYIALKYTQSLGIPIPNEIPSPPPEIGLNKEVKVLKNLENLSKKNTPPEIYRSMHKEELERLKASYKHVMYTDGSKTEAQTACAVIMMDTETMEETESRQYALHPETSAYEAEIYALYKAISMAHARDLDVVIYTDSKSAIKAITAKSTEENLNRVSKQTIQRATSEIRLAWIPGHVGITGNEAADRRARQGGNQTDDRHTPPCESLVRRAARKEIERRKKREWEEERTFLSKHWKETTPQTSTTTFPAG